MREKCPFVRFREYEPLANLLVRVTDDNALYKIKHYLEVPIARIGVEDILRCVIFINGVRIFVTSDPLEVAIVLDNGRRIELNDGRPYAEQVLAYLKSINTDDGFWEYKGYEIVKVGSEGLYNQKFELRKEGANPIKLTLSLGESKNPEAVKRKIQGMVDRILAI
jgi:hypothetical protein